MASRPWKWLCVVLAGLLTAAIFWPVLQADFLIWDDDTNFTGNPYLKGISWQSLHWMFLEFYVWRYEPLTWLTWAGIYDLAGLNPMAFHAASLLLHVGNAMLAVILLRQLVHASLPGPLSPADDRYLSGCAVMGALLWSLHPLRVEAVAWASSLGHCQAGFFMLLSMVAYLRSRVVPGAPARRGWFWGSVASFLCAMLTFPIAAGLAGALLAFDYYPLRRFKLERGGWWTPETRRLLLEKVPFVVITLLLLGMAVWMRRQDGAVGGGEAFGVAKRLMQVSYVWAHFVWKPWVPFHLTPVYTHMLDFRATDLPYILSAVVLVGLTAVLLWYRTRWKLGIVLWIFHLAMVFPMCGWVEQKYFPSDRYDLMAGIAWSILLVWGLWQWRQRARLRLATLAAAGLLLVGLATLTIRQVDRWQNGSVFFPYVLSQIGQGDMYYGPVTYRLGCSYLAEGRIQEAELAFRETVRVLPRSKMAHTWLAMTLAMGKKSDEAERSYKRALEIAPDYVLARQNLGMLYSWRNQWEEAAAQFQEILRQAPEDAAAHLSLAAVLLKQGKTNEAQLHQETGLRLRAAGR